MKSNNEDRRFAKLFHEGLEPMLRDAGFVGYKLQKGWIQPAYLMKQQKKPIWFECSWDWRDRVYDARLGRLYRFRDVLPRVIVVGISFGNDALFQSSDLPDLIEHTKTHLMALFENDFSEYSSAIDKAHDKMIDRLRQYIQMEVLSEKELPFSQW